MDCLGGSFGRTELGLQETRAEQVTLCEEVLRNVLLTGKKRQRTNAAHGEDATRPAKTHSKEQFTRWVLE